MFHNFTLVLVLILASSCGNKKTEKQTQLKEAEDIVLKSTKEIADTTPATEKTTEATVENIEATAQPDEEILSSQPYEPIFNGKSTYESEVGSFVRQDECGSQYYELFPNENGRGRPFGAIVQDGFMSLGPISGFCSNRDNMYLLVTAG